MILSLLAGAALIFGIMFVGNWLMRSPSGSLKRRLGGGLIPLLLVLVAVLALTGRLGLAFATLMAMAPWVMRGLQMWQAGRTIRDMLRPRPKPQAQTETRQAPSPPRPGTMDRSEALRVLGLPETATADEVQAAYRRLMGQVHPDKGGSDWMAAKLNEARERLLSD
ncbi:DnaJ domain-containing protein [Novispirillum itersonii]|uniref:J domain-containing protein n=1 Tax=Novispirillum itersonii TaxID=189 RepID=A0A7W9ZDX8_NOVIT|nr:DnaJ domain-containing protein [Novispirillum itersonii]MBB6209465.1 hypothetical protein [Novispirillum itersonii]